MRRRSIGIDEPRSRRLRAFASLLGVVFSLVSLVACTATPRATAPLPTWPVPPEQLRSASSGSAVSAEFGAATWALDPQFPSPFANTTELHILVWERACSGGSPATGRMSGPVVEYTSASVTITIGVRPIQAAPGMLVTCPMPPGTPATMQLGEPLGTRDLLDGGHIPPAPPSPAND